MACQIGIGLEKGLVTVQRFKPPYLDNINYSKDPRCIGKISCEKEEFFTALEMVTKEIHRILKPTKVIAWLIGDQCKKRPSFQ